MVYVVRVSCHIYLDIHLDIHLDIYLGIYLNVSLDIHLNVCQNVHLHVYLTSSLTASRPSLHYLAPQSVNAIKVQSLVLPSSSTVNLRS